MSNNNHKPVQIDNDTTFAKLIKTKLIENNGVITKADKAIP